jgi:hypothetical protein
MELKRLVRNVRVDMDIATVLDRIVNSVGWSGSSEVVRSGCIGQSAIRLVPLRPISEDEKTRKEIRVEVMSDAA